MNEETVILIAEDDAGHFALVKKNLWRSCTYNDILHFADGRAILDFLLMKGDGPHMTPDTPYILLLDIRMPKVDGIEVLHEIRAEEALKVLPVIMLTTTDNPTEVDRCYKAGCNSYIVKPSDYNMFMACVEQLGMFLSIPSLQVPRLMPIEKSRNVTGQNL